MEPLQSRASVFPANDTEPASFFAVVASGKPLLLPASVLNKTPVATALPMIEPLLAIVYRFVSFFAICDAWPFPAILKSSVLAEHLSGMTFRVLYGFPRYGTFATAATVTYLLLRPSSCIIVSRSENQ